MSMFPFPSRWQWWRAPGYLHLVEALEEHVEDYDQPFRGILRNRGRRIRLALNLRTGVLVLLNLSLLGTALAWGARVVPGLAEARYWIRVAGSLTGLTAATTVAYLLLVRYLGQLQADLLAIMLLGGPGGPTIGEEERQRLARFEQSGKDRG
jgi:hypothetical protein